MKTNNSFLIFFTVILFACNNNPKPVETIEDTTATPNADGQRPDTISSTDSSEAISMPIDSTSANFLQKAADGGLAEVRASRLALEKTKSAAVKRFAEMMVNDHSGVNEQVSRMASSRGVQLPAEPAAGSLEKITQMASKVDNNFDRDYMNMMVNDHKKTILLFEKGTDNVKDSAVKGFIKETLPKLKIHLDSAVSISQTIPKK